MNNTKRKKRQSLQIYFLWHGFTINESLSIISLSFIEALTTSFYELFKTKQKS